MRKRLSFLSAVLAAGMLMGGSVNAQTQKVNLKDRAMHKAPRTSFVNKKMANATAFSQDPSKISAYYIDGDSLILEDATMYEYLKPGVVSKDVSVVVNDERTEYHTHFYKYNENDVMIENLFGVSVNDTTNIELYKKSMYKLDEIIKDLRIKEEDYINANNEPGEPVWQLNHITEKSIVRDAKDRILSITKKGRWADSDIKALGKLECEYGDSVNPVIVKAYEADAGELVLNKEGSDIVWAECNNQVRDITELTNLITVPNSKQNRVLSMKYSINNGNYKDNYEYNFVYDEKNRTTEKKIKLVYENGNEISVDITKIEYPDDFGSYNLRYLYGEDVNEDGVVSEDEIKVVGGEKAVYDEQYNNVEELYLDPVDGGSLEVAGGIKSNIVYDDKMRIIEITDSMYFADGYVPFFKYVYEYDDTTTGIASVSRDNVNLKVNGYVVSFVGAEGRYMVSNADGRLVMSGSAADGWVSLENLPAGLYIVKVNGKAVKVIR